MQSGEPTDETCLPSAEGLTEAAARARLAEVGPNALPERAPPPIWRRVLSQLANPLVYVLLGALALEIATWAAEGASSVPFEAIMIAGLVALNAGLGAAQEAKADHAMAALRAFSAPRAWARRDGRLVEVDARTLVPGDVVRVRAGERVPADAEIVDAHGLAVDESLLTGESLPVEKAASAVLHSGTLTTRGFGFAHVLRTGAKSATGALAASLSEVAADRTPLERRLRALGNGLAWAMGSLSVVLGAAGYFVGGFDGFVRLILFGAALAVAAVPEGLPAAATLTLALGVKRMTTRNAIVRKYGAVETLGCVTVIATDKTGTLTENRVSVSAVETDDEDELLAAMSIVNDSAVEDGDGSLDACLLAYAAQRRAPVALHRARARRSTRPFDSAWKFARVSVDVPSSDGSRERIVSYLKGAPEVILARLALDAATRDALERRAAELAREGYRVLAFARGEGEVEEGLEFLGFALLRDPPRPEVAGAIAEAQRARIRVLMMTGDHPETARAIAREVGIRADSVLVGADLDALDDAALARAAACVDVFARVRPEHKLRLVDALARAGEIVAVTGDGVNDAPALKRSAVGVAMGKRGSDVARGVADIVLADDNFASIVAAIEEGRNAYENIQAFIRFTLASNLGLVLVMLVGAIRSLAEAGASHAVIALPLTALQLLWINFLGDGPPALAVVLDRDPSRMQRRPRSSAATSIDRGSLRFIARSGVSKGLFASALMFGLEAVGAPAIEVQSAVFLFASIAKLVSIYPARITRGRLAPDAGGAPGGTARANYALAAIVIGGVVLQVLTVVLPLLRRVLEVSAPRGGAIALIALATIVDLAIAFGIAGFTSRARPRDRAPRAPQARLLPPMNSRSTEVNGTCSG